MADIIKHNNDFENIIAIIERSKARAIKAVNTEMIEMYWQIGKYISEKANNDGWGKSVVQDFSDFLKQTYPAAGGFSAQNIWRMKQFYETYKNNEKLSPLVRERYVRYNNGSYTCIGLSEKKRAYEPYNRRIFRNSV